MSTSPDSTLVMNGADLSLCDGELSSEGDTFPMKPCTYCLFLGDISLFCTEEDLIREFSAFGELADVRIKRNKVTKRNLSFGFVEYHDFKCAEAAIRAMNGKLICGRALKVTWSGGKDAVEETNNKQDGAAKSMSIYVSFNSSVPNLTINDESLRNVFMSFGPFVDVSVKQSVTDKQTKCQRGYAFVCFETSEKGMQAAVNAASNLADCNINGVHYRCELSNNLRNKLSGTPNSVKHAPAAQGNRAAAETKEPRAPSMPYQAHNSQAMHMWSGQSQLAHQGYQQPVMMVNYPSHAVGYPYGDGAQYQRMASNSHGAASMVVPMSNESGRRSVNVGMMQPQHIVYQSANGYYAQHLPVPPQGEGQMSHNHQMYQPVAHQPSAGQVMSYHHSMMPMVQTTQMSMPTAAPHMHFTSQFVHSDGYASSPTNANAYNSPYTYSSTR